MYTTCINCVTKGLKTHPLFFFIVLKLLYNHVFKYFVIYGGHYNMFNMRYDQKRIRKYHYFLLLSLIQRHKEVSRAQLAKLTSISNTTVGKIIKVLIEDGLVNEVGQTVGEVGRRATILKINPEGAYIIGVEINLTNTEIAIVALDGTILKSNYLKLNANQKPEKVLNEIAINIENLINQVSLVTKEKIIAIGIGMPGLITWPDGEVLVVPQFHWNNVKVTSFLEEKLDYFVYVDTDVRTALLAESFFGSMTNHQNAVCIYIGSGVGGAVMMNGEIVRGHHNMLGEIGHITLDPNGSLCDCGRLGCLQTYICSSDLEKKAQRPIKDIFAAYDLKEDWAVRLIEQARNYLGMTISNISCLYNPEAILITGPMIQEFPQLIDNIDVIADSYIWSPLKKSYELVKPTVGKNSGIIGASAIVLKEFLRFTNDDI